MVIIFFISLQQLNNLVVISKPKKNNLVPEKMQMIAEIARTSSWIANRYTTFLKPYGISTQLFNILRVLRTANDWITMNEVNELMIIKSPNITRLTDKLIDKKLISRKRSTTDRRVVYVKILDAGLNLLTDIDAKHEGIQSEYMNQFSEEEALMITEVLKRIRS